MEEYKETFIKLEYIQSESKRIDYLTEMSYYETGIKVIKITIEKSKSCPKCAENLAHIVREVDNLYKIPSNEWKIDHGSEIFHRWIYQSNHLAKEHGYHNKGKRIFSISLYLILVDILLFILFIMGYVYPVFFTSIAFYFIASKLEILYLKILKKEYV